MDCVVVGIHETDCFTYIVNERGCVLLKIKEELSFKLKTSENIDGYIHGLSNGLHRDMFDGFAVLIIYFNHQRMSVSFQIADKLSQKGCPYVSVLAAAHALVPISEELLKRDSCFELWEILGELYQVRCYNGELSLVAANGQRGRTVRSVNAGEICFFTPYNRNGIYTNMVTDKQEKFKQAVIYLWEKFNSEENSLLDEIYILMGMAGEMKSHRQLLKRLSCAFALYHIPETGRSNITKQRLEELTNDRTNPYIRLSSSLKKEIKNIYDFWLIATGFSAFSAEEWTAVKKEIRDYIVISELGDANRLQDIKNELITKKLDEIWRESERYIE